MMYVFDILDVKDKTWGADIVGGCDSCDKEIWNGVEQRRMVVTLSAFGGLRA